MGEMQRLGVFSLLACVLLLAACGSAASQPAASPTATPSPRPSPTLRVTASPTATAALTPSSAPTPLPAAPPTRAPTAAPAPPPPPVTPPVPPINLYHPPPYKIAIDAGHGGPNYIGAAHTDATGHVDLREKDVTLDVALRLNDILLAAGYETVLTRGGDYTLTDFPADTADNRHNEIQARVDVVNAAQADILVSIHFNGSPDPSTGGTEVYCDPDRSFGANSCALGDLVRQTLVSAIRGFGYDTLDRGLKNDSQIGGDPSNPHSWILGENPTFQRPSLMPGIIGEGLFVSNDVEAQLLQDPNALQTIAEGYHAGIDAYFGWLSAQQPQ